MAQAVTHTSGQAPMMAFQAGGPHAQDRGLEAVTYAWQAMKAVPPLARWEKPQGKHDPLVLEKRYHIVPRGVALVVACSTFPTWNTYPGLFASLVTGNPVVVKAHPGAHSAGSTDGQGGPAGARRGRFCPLAGQFDAG